MGNDYTTMAEDALRKHAKKGDNAAHFELGRRSAGVAKAEPHASRKSKGLRRRQGIGGTVLWGVFQLISIAAGPTCVAGLLYTAYYVADDVYFGYHDYTIPQMCLWYIGTFFFVGLMLRMSTIATQYLLKRRPFSTLLIIAAICWYLYTEVPVDSFF